MPASLLSALAGHAGCAQACTSDPRTCHVGASKPELLSGDSVRRVHWQASSSSLFGGLQGIAALMAMNILEEEDMTSVAWGSADHLHVGIEAMRLGFADALAYDADPEVGGLPLTVRQRMPLASANAHPLRKLAAQRLSQ